MNRIKANPSLCPKCGYPQFCPCKICHPSNTLSDFKPWIWLEDGYTVRCAGCGFEAGADYWEDLDFKRFNKGTYATKN